MFYGIFKRAKAHRHPRTRVVCVVTRGGSVLATGTNTPHGLHAEVNALRKLSHPQGTTLYVLRLRKDNSIGMSKPCAACMKYITEKRVKWINYTTQTGQWKKFRVPRPDA